MNSFHWVITFIILLSCFRVWVTSRILMWRTNDTMSRVSWPWTVGEPVWSKHHHHHHHHQWWRWWGSDGSDRSSWVGANEPQWMGSVEQSQVDVYTVSHTQKEESDIWKPVLAAWWASGICPSLYYPKKLEMEKHKCGESSQMSLKGYYTAMTCGVCHRGGMETLSHLLNVGVTWPVCIKDFLWNMFWMSSFLNVEPCNMRWKHMQVVLEILHLFCEKVNWKRSHSSELSFDWLVSRIGWN